MDDAKIISELGTLIKRGNYFADKLYSFKEIMLPGYTFSNKNNRASVQKWECCVRNILRLRFGPNSYFYNEFSNAIISNIMTEKYYCENIKLAVSMLEFIKESLEKGFTDDLFYKHEIILFGDMLKQAEEFLKQKFKLAAAIYGRIILELTIIEYANKNNINTKRKFNEIIIDLKKKELIHGPFENSLRANYKIGSLAAHGDKEFNLFSDSEIREFLSFIRDKVLILK